MKGMRILAVLALLFSFAACGEEKQVGSGVEAGELSGEQNRLGEMLEEAENEGVGDKAALGAKQDEQEQQAQQEQDPEQAAAAAEQQRQQQIQQQQEQAAFAFTITAEGYNPYYIRIFQGGTIRVTNEDAKARSVTADKGEFDSGMLAPGQSWVGGPFDTVGTFNFHDESRPYVVGTLEVCAKSGC